MQSKTGSLIHLPADTPEFPSGLRKLVALVVPESTNNVVQNTISHIKPAPFKGPKKGNLNVPVSVQTGVLSQGCEVKCQKPSGRCTMWLP